MNRKRGRPQGSISKQISEAQLQEILELYKREISVPGPRGRILDPGKEERLTAKNAYRIEIEKILIDDTGYADYIFDRVTRSVRRSRQPLTQEAKDQLTNDIYPDYISRVRHLIHSDKFAQKLLSSTPRMSMSGHILSPSAKIKEELRIRFRNLVLKVIDEQSVSLGIDPIWKKQWSTSTQSMDQGLRTSSGDSTTVGETMADLSPEANPEIAHGDLERRLQWDYPELDVFIPEIIAHAIVELMEGEVVTIDAALVAVTEAVNNHIAWRKEIYNEELKRGKIEPDDEDFADVAYYRDDAYVAKLIKDIAETIVAAQKGYALRFPAA